MKFASLVFRIAFPILLVAANTGAHAADGMSYAFGTGNSTRMARIGAQWSWDKKWSVSEGLSIGGYWDLSIAQWQGRRYRSTDNHQNITDIGITPVFRLQKDSRVGWYGEGGVGAHLLSSLYDNGGRQLSTAFEFGDHIGIGYVTASGIDVGLLIQHFSNGVIKHPNDGVNFAVLRVSHSF